MTKSRTENLSSQYEHRIITGAETGSSGGQAAFVAGVTLDPLRKQRVGKYRGETIMSVWMDYLFGCAHRNTSFPITHRRETAAGGQPSGVPRATYIVCLDCGKEFPYSWEKMKFLRGKAKEGMAVGAAAGSSPPRR